MKLTILDDQTDIAANAKGGTEIMRDGLFSRVDKDLLDKFQIICSRPNVLDPDKIKILWCHDLAEDPAVSRLSESGYRDQFDLFVFVSNWQMEKYKNTLGIPYSKSIVLENAIVPIDNCNDKSSPVFFEYFHLWIMIACTIIAKLLCNRLLISIILQSQKLSLMLFVSFSYTNIIIFVILYIRFNIKAIQSDKSKSHSLKIRLRSFLFRRDMTSKNLEWTSYYPKSTLSLYIQSIYTLLV
jgi:hypothetical protein